MHRVLALSAMVTAVACGGEPLPQDAWQGTIETVNGRTIVRNPPVGMWGMGVRGRLVEDLRIGAEMPP